MVEVARSMALSRIAVSRACSIGWVLCAILASVAIAWGCTAVHEMLPLRPTTTQVGPTSSWPLPAPVTWPSPERHQIDVTWASTQISSSASSTRNGIGHGMMVWKFGLPFRCLAREWRSSEIGREQGWSHYYELPFGMPLYPLMLGLVSNVCVFLTIAVVFRIFIQYVRGRKFGMDQCPICGYSRSGLQSVRKCPECGSSW